MKTKCTHCQAEYEVDNESSGMTAECTGCGREFTVTQAKAVLRSTAKRSAQVKRRPMADPNDPPVPMRRGSSTSTGCLLPLLGLGILLAGIIGIFTVILPLICIPLGLFLIAKGERGGHWLECGSCGTRLSSKRVTRCPGCGVGTICKTGFIGLILRVIGVIIAIGAVIGIVTGINAAKEQEAAEKSRQDAPVIEADSVIASDTAL